MTAQVTKAVIHLTHLTFRGDVSSAVRTLLLLGGDDDWTAPSTVLPHSRSGLQLAAEAGTALCSTVNWACPTLKPGNWLLSDILGGFVDISINSGGDSSSVGCVVGWAPEVAVYVTSDGGRCC